MISLEIVPFGLAIVKEKMCVSWRKCLRLEESWNAELWSSFEMSAWIFQQSTLLAEIPTDLHRTRNWWNKRFSYHVISTSQKVFVAPQQIKSCLKKDQKTIFLSVEQFIVKTQFEISKYLLQFLWAQIFAGAVLEELFNSSPKLWRSEGKNKKKASLYVKFCVSYQLVLQICKESETEPKS